MSFEVIKCNNEKLTKKLSNSKKCAKLTTGQQIFDFRLHLLEQRLPGAGDFCDLRFQMSKKLNQHSLPARLVDEAVFCQNFDCPERDVRTLAIPLSILRPRLVVPPGNRN